MREKVVEVYVSIELRIFLGEQDMELSLRGSVKVSSSHVDTRKICGSIFYVIGMVGVGYR